MTEPKNEPVRIALPPRPDKASLSGNSGEHPAGRIVLPAGQTHSTPKNETVRFSSVPPVPLAVPSSQLDAFDAIPPTFQWALFGIASVNFLIQIWIYVVS